LGQTDGHTNDNFWQHWAGSSASFSV